MTLIISHTLRQTGTGDAGGADNASLVGVHDGATGMVAVTRGTLDNDLQVTRRPNGVTTTSGGATDIDDLDRGSIARLNNGTLVVTGEDFDSVVRVVLDANGVILSRDDLGDVGSVESRVIALNTGGYAILWADKVTPNDFNLELRYFSATGVEQANITLDGSEAIDLRGEMVLLANGNIAVTWNRRTGSHSENFYAIYSSTGAIIRSPTQITSLGSENGDPEIAATPNGFVIVHNVETPAGVGLAINDFNLSGVPGAARIEPVGLNVFDDPSVLSLSNGMLVVSTRTAEREHIVMLLGATSDRAVIDTRDFVSLQGGADLIYSGAGRFTNVFVDPDSGSTYNHRTDLVGLEVLRTVTGDNAADTWTGDDIASIVNAGGGNDQLNGGVAAETLNGQGGNDVINGGGGNDILSGGSGNDTLNGGAGADTADYSLASSAVTARLDTGATTNDGTGGTDTLISIENLIGSAFNDQLRGDGLNNRLVGGAGADTLTGLGGNDVLEGGTGAANVLIGGLGNDLYRVSALGDSVVELAGEGTDTVETTLGVFTLGANVENLTYTGSGTFTGTGNAANNVITGGSGDDLLSGRGGNDTLQGRFGGGRDTATYAAAAGSVTASLNDGFTYADGDGGTDTLLNIDDLIGSAFGDSLIGNVLDNKLQGGAGNDVLSGLGGADILIGGAGNDNLRGGDGIDTADYSSAAAAVTAQLNTGAASNDGNGGSDTFSGIENLTGSAFNDVLLGDGGSNVLRGGAGYDVLIGLAGNDILHGGAGVANELYGGTGDDYYVVEAGDTVVEQAGEGADSVEARVNVYSLGANIENLVFGGTGDFVGTGNGLNNLIVGGAGDDVLRGGGGSDQIQGGGGTDRLVLLGVQADYSITAEGGGWRIIDLTSGSRDGSILATSIELVEFGDKSTITLTPPANPGAVARFDADDAQVLPGAFDGGLAKDGHDQPLVQPSVFDDAVAAKGGYDVPLVQPGSVNDDFLDLKVDTDGVGPQIQPGVFDDLNDVIIGDTGGLGFGTGHGGGGGDGGDTSGFWGMDPDIQRALDDHAGRLDHMRGTAHVSDPWG